VMTALCPRRVLSAALAVFSLGISIPVPASGNARNSTGGVRVVEGVPFAETYRDARVSLRLLNAALLRYKVIFRAYVAGLYLPEGADPDSVLGEVPKRLEIQYFWAIPADDIGKAGEEILSRNVDEATLSSLRSRLERIRAAYRDVKPGDRYALTYIPGSGTELSFNGTPLVLIEGDDFAAAYFSIWLGKRPLDQGLKDNLLRKGRGPA